MSGIDAERFSRLHILNGNVSDEESVQTGLKHAKERFGLVNILVVNPAHEEKARQYPIWDMPLDEWEKTYQSNVRSYFVAIKHFLRSMNDYQQTSGTEVANPAIVLVEAGTGESVATGKAGLHNGLLSSVRQEIVDLSSEGRINTVTSGASGETPEDVARTIAFLASRRAARNVSGQCIQVERGKSLATKDEAEAVVSTRSVESIPRGMGKPKRNKIRVAVSIDLDAVSGWLGTSQ